MIQEGLINPRDVHSAVREEMDSVVERARAAGARGPLEYKGAGAFGIVLCDGEGTAWKVYHGLEAPSARPYLLDVLASEYEWLVAAAETSIAPHVAQVYGMHPDELALERECVQGFPGTWSDQSALDKLHAKIEKAMIPAGWSAPEFKEDSYILREDGIPILADVTGANRLGMNLAGYVEDVLEGKRKTDHSWHDLGFFIARELGEKAIPREIGLELFDRLIELEPELKKSFSVER